MNKQEAIKKVEQMGEYERFVDESIPKLSVLNILNQLDEPQKPVVPQFVADWIEECKNDDFHLFGAMEEMSLHQKKLDYWFREDDNIELFARAWLDGYTVEEEKRYYVKTKKIADGCNYLNCRTSKNEWSFAGISEPIDYRTRHTREELEDAGFGWVFDCPGVEIEEVEE